MRAILLAGGAGTRLRPLTYTTPKPLLPVCNQPFLERQLTWLARFGVTDVTLALGYLADPFVEHFPGETFGDITLSYAVEPEALGTAGAIKFAADQIHVGTDERIVVCNGDVLTDLDLSELVEFHADHSAEATISLTRVDDPSRFGVVPTDSDGRVRAFVEKPPPGKAPSHWINAGTYILEGEMLDRIPLGVNTSIERETFPRMLAQDGRLFAMESAAYWLDVGVPAQYLQAHHDLLNGRLGDVVVPGAVRDGMGPWTQGAVVATAGSTCSPNTLLGGGTHVADGAVVVMSSVGSGCEIGRGALVRDAVLGDGAVVEPGARVEHSIIGPGAVVGAGAVVQQISVVGAGAMVPAGSTQSEARINPPGDFE
ncbi:MAG: NDP-sugar synthase [Acidimicrobiia bacterium]|nr:NDP-sugar synthase [Acidimicrobiia bacterium]